MKIAIMKAWEYSPVKNRQILPVDKLFQRYNITQMHATRKPILPGHARVKKQIPIICFAGLLFMAILPQGLLAQAHIDEDNAKLTLYVDVASPKASDTSAGTQASPLKTISAAVIKAGSQNARILIAPGDYREYVTVPSGDNLLIFQAGVPGKVIVSGADIYKDWKPVENGVYSHPWFHDWGLGNETGWWGSTAYNRRREMVFVNGQRLEQVCDTAGKPVAPGVLREGQFAVADASGGAAGTIWIKPAKGVDVQTAVIEVAERGMQRGVTNDSKPLVQIDAHSNVVLRGMVFQHCANYMKFGPAVSFMGYYPGDYNKLPRNVLVEDCVVVQNNGIGMEISNYRDVTVRRSRFNNNGERGSGSVQVGLEKEKTIGVKVNPRNFLYEDCQFNDNDWRMNGTWGEMNDAAGFKMFGQNIDSYTFVRCQFSRNYANGFWQDYSGSNVVLDHCIAENNLGGASGGYGILSEMSRGPLTLKNCVIRNNGNVGFISSGAPNVTIQDSFLYYNCQDVKYNGQRLHGHELAINSDTQRDSGDFIFGVKGWKLLHNTFASFGDPVGKGYLFHLGGANFPSGRTPQAEFAAEIVSDSNTFSKSPEQGGYFPGRKVMYSPLCKSAEPDMELAAWQTQANTHGRQDARSKFVYPLDMSEVADPTTAVPAASR